MPVLHTIGIDPGLVHTGVVRMLFDREHKKVKVESAAIPGLDAETTRDWIEKEAYRQWTPTIFIEKYVPRRRFDTDERMVQGEVAFRNALPRARLVRNTGASQIANPAVMSMLGVWSFDQTTHHQDLRAAARIMLYGMMKDQVLNRVLADVIRDQLDGNGWEVLQ